MRETPHTCEGAGLDTKAIHAGQEPDAAFGAVAAPIYQTSTFAFASPEVGAARFAGQDPGYIYTRLGNPTIERLEECVAALEGGYGALAVATGMAAVSTVFLSFLQAGDHVVGTDTVYGPTRLILENEFARYGVLSTFVDTAEMQHLEAAMRPNTKMVYLETPANPTIKLADLAKGARIAASRGARLVVDNTFASPILQRPFELGANVILHSTTKYLNGHADVVGGVIIARTTEDYARMRKVRAAFGGTMDPNQAWLILRGIKTLGLRVRAAQENAGALAVQLEQHRAVARVFYPGLPSHPQHELGRRQMDGPGSMIAFELEGGYDAGVTLMKSLHLMTLAVSLGGVETLIEHPASMTHAGVPRAERLAAGITDGLVRLAVGCENLSDLRADLAQALDRVG